MPIINVPAGITTAQNPARIAEFVSNPEPVIRQTVAQNPQTTIEQLQTLAADPVLYVAATARKELSRRGVG